MTMTAGLGLDAELAAYWAECCERKVPWSARGAREAAARMRRDGHRGIEAYHCPFCSHHHVGRALSMERLQEIAGLLRRRNGGACVTPGTGTTRRQRRKAARHG